MRNYRKQNAPDVLKNWNRSNRAWEDFVADPTAYSQVKLSLLGEQNHLCCYCESAIKDSGSHIEHYEPRSRVQNRTYKYANLACSCNGSVGRDRHCGHKKGRDYDNRLFINPSVDNSGKFFSYDTNGGISAAYGLSADETQRVDYMVRLLNLSCARLTGMRRAHGRSIVQIINGFIEANANDLLREMAHFYLIPDNNEQLQPFFSLSLQLFGEIGSEIVGER